MISRLQWVSVEYRAASDVQDEHLLLFVERYEDGPALEAHVGYDHYQAFEAVMGDLLAGEHELLGMAIESVANIDPECVHRFQNRSGRWNVARKHSSQWAWRCRHRTGRAVRAQDRS